MTLVIGYGNPLRCDDGLGPYLAERLGEPWHRAMFITSIQLTPELVEPISRAERVVFIDANVGEMPGTVACETVLAQTSTGAFTHNVSPASLLAAARDLYSAAPPALLISVTGASFDYRSEFSPEIRTLLPKITDAVVALVAKFGDA